MYCEQVQQIENKFLADLQKIDRFEIKANSLFLYAGKEMLLEFEAAPVAPN
jgi:heat shock protein HslJ